MAKSKNFKTDTEVAVYKAKKVAKTKIKSDLDQSDVQELLRSDDKFKQYRRIVKAIRESVDMDKLDIELKNLHSGRSSRRLYGKTPSADSIINATLQDASNRSRIAEISVEISRQLSLLETATAAIKKHILHEFREHTSGYRTKGERQAFADQYLGRGLHLIDQFTNFVDRANYILKDTDQTGYSIKAAVQCLEILYSSKNDKRNV
jgi:hypothetical protein